MGNRIAARTALAAVGGLLAAPLLATAAPAGEGPPLPTVDLEVVCPGNQLVVTIDNQTGLDYEVTVEVGPDGQPPTATEDVSLPSGTTEELTFPFPGSPAAVVVTGDGDFPTTTFSPVFGCATERDFDVTTPEGTPVEIDLGAPCSAPATTEHGTTEQVDNFTIRYTPAPGFVGVDTFDYTCTASANQFGTVTVTVTPAQAPPPAEPVPESPTFTG